MPLLKGRFTKKPITPAGDAPTHAVVTVRGDRCHIDRFVVETHRARSPLFALNVAHAHAVRHPVRPLVQAALLLVHRQTLPNRQTARPAPRLCLATVGQAEEHG